MNKQTPADVAREIGGFDPDGGCKKQVAFWNPDSQLAETVFRLALILLLITVFSRAVVHAGEMAAVGDGVQEKKKNAESSDETSGAENRPVAELPTPRAALSNFFEAMETGRLEQATVSLDLEFLDKATRSSKQKSICDKLYVLLHDRWKVDPQLSPSVDVDSPFPLDTTIGLIDDPNAAVEAARIELARNSTGNWQFTAASIRLVDEELFDKWNDEQQASSIPTVEMSFPMWLESQIPGDWKRRTFLIKDYQWIALVVVMLVGFAVDILARYLLNFLTNTWFRYVAANENYRAKRNLWKPVGLLLNALTWYFGATLIDLPAGFLLVLLVGLKLFAVFASIWTAFSAINLLGDYLLRKAEKTESRYDDLLIPFLKNGLKILAVCIGLVVFVDVFSLNWNSLLGGFGLGGIAIAIASKDVLGNVFGSLTVLTDRPFEIGDWVITEGVEGEVEAVGVRSSRIRTFYNSLVVVPNSRLTTAIVDNMGRRQFRRVKTLVGVEYGTTPDQLEAFCEGIRELIRLNEFTRKDYFHVFVNEFAASSINILLYFFLKTPNWAGELQEKHNIMLAIIRLAAELKINFAFPTQTLHVFQEAHDDSGIPGPPSGVSPRDWGRQVANREAEKQR